MSLAIGLRIWLAGNSSWDDWHQFCKPLMRKCWFWNFHFIFPPCRLRWICKDASLPNRFWRTNVPGEGFIGAESIVEAGVPVHPNQHDQQQAQGGHVEAADAAQDGHAGHVMHCNMSPPFCGKVALQKLSHPNAGSKNP